MQLCRIFSFKVSNKALLEASDLFDAEWYSARYPDLHGLDALSHYLDQGGVEGRACGPDFDGGWYLEQYRDVREARINPLIHYLRYGRDEGRQPRPSPQKAQELRDRAITTIELINAHKLVLEDDDRTLLEASDLFDAEWYSARYPDLHGLDALSHYLDQGGVEGRACGPDFDGGWYLEQYRDVREARINPLIHYLRYGRDEGRCLHATQSLVTLLNLALPSLMDAEPSILAHQAPEKIDRITTSYSVKQTTFTSCWLKIFERFKRNYLSVIMVGNTIEFDKISNLTNKILRDKVPSDEDFRSLIVITDRQGYEIIPEKYKSFDIIDISPIIHVLCHTDKVSIVELILLTMAPKCVINVDTDICWDAFENRGYAISNTATVFACFLDSTDGTKKHRISEIFRRLSKNVNIVNGFYFEDDYSIRILTEEYIIPNFHVYKLKCLSDI